MKLVKEGGVKVAQAARDLGIYETSLRRWVKQYETDHGEGPADALTSKEKEEFRRLRRENRTLKMEREILKNGFVGAKPPFVMEATPACRLSSLIWEERSSAYWRL